jgi:kinetochore protein Nuf2
MHNYVPDLPLKDIVQYFNDIEIELRQSDLLKPSNMFLLRLYENLLVYFTNTEINYNIDEALYQMIIYKRMYAFLSKIGSTDFNIKDLNCDSRRLINILSYVVNYSMYRDTKKGIYYKIKQMNNEKNVLKDDIEKKIKLREKDIKNLKNNLSVQNKNKDNLEREILDLDNELKEIIKIQRGLVNETEKMKMDRDELNDKLNSYQLLIMNLKQDIECLKTQIVSDPTKLVSLLKEMKELLNKENFSLKNLENENVNLTNRINFFIKSKEDFKSLISKSVLLNNVSIEIDNIESFVSNTDIVIQNIESTINASKIRLNYIIRQISHIESKIYNLQENDKKCSEEIYGKMDKLKGDYKDISKKRNTTQDLIDDNIKKCKNLEYEIIKIKNEHECYVNDIINLLNNIKDNQAYYFNNIRRNL